MSYTFQDDVVPSHSTRKHRKNSKSRHTPSGSQQNEYGGNQQQPDDNSKCGSLTYSASSSVAGSSGAGESSDSSFADIMKVLDESSELALLMTKEGNEEMRHLFEQAEHHRSVGHSARGHRSAHSNASSLQYSEDGESAQESTTSMAGQPSDSHAHDGGGLGGDVMFEPASPADEGQSRRNKREGGSKNGNKQRSKNDRSSSEERANNTRATSRASPVTISDGSTSTPTSPPPRASRKSRAPVDSPIKKRQEIWYNQWWMCGFADALSSNMAYCKKSYK